MEQKQFTTLFLDIGGVLLSNGWGHEFRHKAAAKFNLDIPEMEERHKRMFVSFEEGKISLDEYLNQMVFFKPRNFSPSDFRAYMFSLTTPNWEMMELMKNIKAHYGLKVVAVSNEARELNAFRIDTFKLDEIFDFFVSSCYVNVRKPDATIFKLALEMAHVTPGEVLYIDDVQIFIDVATELGITSICHTDASSTEAELKKYGYFN